jgi:hypothetical protein
MKRLAVFSLALILVCLLLLSSSVAAPGSVHELRVQTVGEQHYFRAWFDAPGLVPEGPLPWMEVKPELLPLAAEWWPVPTPSLVPRLVPAGPELRLVTRSVGGGRSVEFLGRYDGKATEAKATFLYPTREGDKLAWKRVPVVLDFTKALPAEGLERNWAKAEVEQLETIAGEAGDFGYYSFASMALSRKHDIRGLRVPATKEARAPFVTARLYDLTTGAAAISESLQLKRMRTGSGGDNEKRTVDVSFLRGIDIAEHPWKQMMGEKKPADEPLAKMIPHDNYFVTFRDPAKVLEFAAMLDNWGGNITRAFEFTSRDYRLWQRYERQLCIDTAALGKMHAGLGIKGVGITGNDAYLRDGTDITVLLPVMEVKRLLAAQEPFLAAARKEHGARLKETKDQYNDTAIESFVTPLREVSLHRAVLGDVVILSNSLVGLKRVLDSAKGNAKRLSDSLDFQYMRTVFRADDFEEDGFAFLPDAFIRNFVSPVSRIKQKRRLEALTSLHMLTHAAMFTAWETGKLPTSTAELMRISGLKDDEVALPDGAAAWDVTRGAAVSEAYGSIHFATPLIELPLTLVTQSEANDYREFREGYIRLWRRFFDPVGMRVAMREGRVKMETYILPLIDSDFYRNLRFVTGNGLLKLDPGPLAPTTLLQYRTHLDPVMIQQSPYLRDIGEWFLVRLDDGPNFAKLFRQLRQAPNTEGGIDELMRRIADLPLAVGVEVKDEKRVRELVKQALAILPLLFNDRWTHDDGGTIQYKGVAIPWTRYADNREQVPEKQRIKISLYVAVFDGACYATLTEAMMRRLIDEAAARKEKKPDPLAQWPNFANSSVTLVPAAVDQSRPVLTRLVELPTHQEARSALAMWSALYRTGVVPPDANPEQAARSAFRFLGFVPTAPDRTPYRHDRAADEMVNDRHGSFRQPVLADGLAETSPLARVLATLRSARVDLRFREDGIHTTITLTRRGAPEAMSKESFLDGLLGVLQSWSRTTGWRPVDPEREERRWAVETLATLDRDAVFTAVARRPQSERDTILAALGDTLDSPRRSERRAAAEALAKLGTEANALLVKGLIRSLKMDRDDRPWTAEFLGKLGPVAKDAIPALQFAMYSRDPEVVRAAVVALKAIEPGSQSWENVPPAVRKSLVADLTEALHSTNREERRWSVDTLAGLGPQPRATLVEELTTALKSPDRRESRWGIEELMKLEPEKKDNTPALVQALTRAVRSWQPAERRWAAETLATFGPAAKEAIPALQVAMYDRNEAVRQAAAAALKEIEPGMEGETKLTPEARATLNADLARAMKSLSKDDRRWAVEELVKVGPDPKVSLGRVLDELTDALTSTDRDDRGWAAHLLGKLGPAAKVAVPALQAARYDTAPGARMTAADALRKIDPEAASATKLSPRAIDVLNGRLARALTATDREERRWAVELSLKVDAEARASMPALLDALRLELKEGAPPDRRWAAETLGSLGADAVSTLPALLDAYQTDENREVQQAALAALGKVAREAGRKPPR